MRQLIALTLLSALSAAALATPPDAPNRLFQGRDLFALQRATDPQIRPDGREIAYVRVSYDIMTDRGRQSIWLIDSDSGEQTPAGHDGRLALAAALVADRGSHRVRLDGRWRPTAAVRALAAKQARPRRSPISPTRRATSNWSPDGKWIAFTMFAPDEKARARRSAAEARRRRVGAAARD